MNLDTFVKYHHDISKTVSIKYYAVALDDSGKRYTYMSTMDIPDGSVVVVETVKGTLIGVVTNLVTDRVTQSVATRNIISVVDTTSIEERVNRESEIKRLENEIDVRLEEIRKKYSRVILAKSLAIYDSELLPKAQELDALYENGVTVK